MDAARSEVFAVRYVLAPDAVLGVRSIGEPVSAPPAEVAAEWAGDATVSHWIGEGVLRYRDQIGFGEVVEETPLLGAAGRATRHAGRQSRPGRRSARVASHLRQAVRRRTGAGTKSPALTRAEEGLCDGS